jgi:hypothetical protein
MGKKKSLPYQAKMALRAVDEAEKEKNEDVGIYSGTLDQYNRDVAKYAKFCGKFFRAKSFNDFKKREFIQAWVDYLEGKGYPATTIHTYVAAVCKTTGICMIELDLPSRHNANNTRSRRKTKTDERKNANPEYSPRLTAFAKRVGIRRDCYKQLRGRNFKLDESGRWCVEVMKGKGGKYHLQPIAEKDVAFVRAYFEGVKPNQFVFTKEEMNNNIDLHAIRGDVAKERYADLVAEFKVGGEAARLKVYKEICARFERFNKRDAPPTYEELRNPYIVRGLNKKRAIEKGYSVEYDRLALLAVSVFYLSHWRVDVAVSNYLLA